MYRGEEGEATGVVDERERRRRFEAERGEPPRETSRRGRLEGERKVGERDKEGIARKREEGKSKRGRDDPEAEVGEVGP